MIQYEKSTFELTYEQKMRKTAISILILKNTFHGINKVLYSELLP